MIGIVAGVILAQISNAIVPADKSGELIRKLGPGVIAIIGGYSAEAVQLILQRLADIITAMVRGDSSAEVKAKLSAEHTAQRSDARNKLVTALTAHATNDAAALNQALTDLDNTLRRTN